MPDEPPQTACDQAGRTTRVVHLSDLHFGFNFQKSNWRQLRSTVLTLKPDLVVVTGDLVNTPWFWMLKRARAALTELKQDLAKVAPNGQCEVWAIPGNHDTKITGLVPVIWLWHIALVCALLAAGSAWLRGLSCAYPVWLAWLLCATTWGWGGLAVLAVVVRLLVTRDLAKAMGDELWLTKGQVSAGGRVGIVPLDSATYDTSWARGEVTADGLAVLKEDLQRLRSPAGPGHDNTMLIAVVHHHVLPLPYDHDKEQMMVMGNAGSVLAELAGHRVRLLLHGHKHHQHFARVVINAATDPTADIAVLSAGTPTQARNAGAFWHGFNVIEIAPDGNATVEMYQGPPTGGAFKVDKRFDLTPPENQDRWRYEASLQTSDIHCERLICSVDINPYGDARFFREYVQVSTPRSCVKKLPSTLVAHAKWGLMEAYTVRGLSSHGPRVTVRPTPNSVRTAERIEVELHFEGAGLLDHDAPIDFFTEVYGNNAFALNQWQAECMYASATGDDADEVKSTEDIRFKVPDGLAVRELIVEASFPTGMKRPRRLSPRIGHRTGEDVSWSWIPPSSLVWLGMRNTAQMRILYPRPGALYQINWDLEENIYGDGNVVRERGIERALELRKWLNTLRTKPLQPKLAQMLAQRLEATEFNARTVLGNGDDQSPLDIALFTFDANDKYLHYLVGTHAEADPRREAHYHYGLGLPGRAFKAGQAVSFRRPPSTPGERPWGYVHPDGKPVLPGDSVPEVAILAIPLAPMEAPDWPYAVLQLSTDTTTVPLRTTDVPQGMSIKDYTHALRLKLTEEIEMIYHGAHHV